MKKKFAGAAAVFAMSIVLGAQCVQAGQWMRDDIGWWWQEDDGSYPKNCPGGWMGTTLDRVLLYYLMKMVICTRTHFSAMGWCR